MPWRRRLVSWLTVLIIAGLSWVLLDKLEQQAQRAELRATALTISQLQAQILLAEVEGRLSRQINDGPRPGGNPMLWLKEPPANYGGACVEAVPPPGQWCFRESSGGGVLRYSPRFPEGLGADGQDTALAWRVVREPAQEPDRGRLRLVAITNER